MSILLRYGEGLKQIFIDTHIPESNNGLTVLIDAPSQRKVLAQIVEPFDPEENPDEDADAIMGEVYWCRRLDKRKWKTTYDSDLRQDNMLLAIHYIYMYSPIERDWDTEENANG